MRKQDITYQDKLNELRLDIAHPNSRGKIYVLLEGETDVRLFRKLFGANCKIENIPGGNPKLEECVRTLVAIHFYVIGIRDADFIHLNTAQYNETNTFLTDLHDIEIIMCANDTVFSATISEFTSEPQNRHLPIRSQILSTIKKLSCLKWFNEQEDLELNFAPGFIDLLQFGQSSMDIEQYINRVLAKSTNPKNVDTNYILNGIAALELLNSNLYQLCNGHDFFKALSMYLRTVHGANDAAEKSIVSAFRIAYTVQHYQTTTLYTNTKRWADENNCVIY